VITQLQLVIIIIIIMYHPTNSLFDTTIMTYIISNMFRQRSAILKDSP